MAGLARAVSSAGQASAKTVSARASLWASIVTATRTVQRVSSASKPIGGLGTTPVPNSGPPTRSALRTPSVKLALTVGMRVPRTSRKTTKAPCSAYLTTRSPLSWRSLGKISKEVPAIGHILRTMICCTMACTVSMGSPIPSPSTVPNVPKLTRSFLMTMRSEHHTSVIRATTRSNVCSNSIPRRGMEHRCQLKARLSRCPASVRWMVRQASVHPYWGLRTMLRAPLRSKTCTLSQLATHLTAVTIVPCAKPAVLPTRKSGNQPLTGSSKCSTGPTSTPKTRK